MTKRRQLPPITEWQAKLLKVALSYAHSNEDDIIEAVDMNREEFLNHLPDDFAGVAEYLFDFPEIAN